MALVDDIRDEILAVMAANELELDGAVAKYNFADKLAHKMIQAASGGSAAEDVTYDNLLSGLTATDVQAAIDELAGGGAEYPTLLSTHWHTFYDVNQSGIAGRAVNRNEFIGAIFKNYADLEVSEARLQFVATAVGNAVVGIYEYNKNLNQWELLTKTIPYDTNLINAQVRSLLSSVTLKKDKFYSIGCNISPTGVTMYSLLFTAYKNYFGFGSNMIATRADCLQFPHTYDGDLPLIVAPAYGIGTVSYSPFIQMR
jgi:hypothetical protein